MHLACTLTPTLTLTSLAGVLPLSACAQQSLVFRGDVLLEIDGHKIADDGTFAVGQQERLSFQHLIHLKLGLGLGIGIGLGFPQP